MVNTSVIEECCSAKLCVGLRYFAVRKLLPGKPTSFVSGH